MNKTEQIGSNTTGGANNGGRHIMDSDPRNITTSQHSVVACDINHHKHVQQQILLEYCQMIVKHYIVLIFKMKKDCNVWHKILFINMDTLSK